MSDDTQVQKNIIFIKIKKIFISKIKNEDGVKHFQFNCVIIITMTIIKSITIVFCIVNQVNNKFGIMQ